jgi:hypothetical protein
MMTTDRRGQPVYDWATIQAVFMAWTGGSNVRAFCVEHHLPYEYARKVIDSQAKEAAVTGSSMTYRTQLRAVMQLQRASSIAKDAKSVSSILADLQDIAGFSVAYARTKFLKTIDGVPSVNPTIAVADAKRLVEMGVKASEILRNVVAISGLPSGDDDHAEPNPVIDEKRPKAQSKGSGESPEPPAR